MSRDFVIGFGSSGFGNSLFNNNYNYNLIDAEFLAASLKNIPLFCTILGALLSAFLINCLLVSKKAVFNFKMTL